MARVRSKRRWGRWLFGTLFLLFAIAYIILWFVVTKPMIGDFVDEWLDEQRAMGYDISYSERRVEGFPLNYELVFDDPVVVAPGGQVKWEGDELRLHSRVWDFYPMLLNRWGNVQAYIPGKSVVTANNGAKADFELGRASKVEVAWTGEALTYGQISIDSFQGDVTEAPGAETQSLGLEQFDFDVKPTHGENEPPVFEVTAGWNKITLPDQVLNDPDTPPMVLSLAGQPQEGLTATIRNGGVYFLGNRVAEFPFALTN